MRLRFAEVSDACRWRWWLVVAVCAGCVAVAAPDVVLAQASLDGKGLERSIAGTQDRVAAALGWFRVFLIVCSAGFFLALFATWMAGRPSVKWLVFLLISLVGIGGHGLLIDYFIDPDEGRAKGTGTGGSVVLEETLR